jgi:lipopolysaccharide export LptBFGC system permease protein LptF
MTAKKIISAARNTALTALATSYLGQSFYRWNFNVEQWGDDGRGAFIWTYMFTFLIYGCGTVLLLSFPEDTKK